MVTGLAGGAPGFASLPFLTAADPEQLDYAERVDLVAGLERAMAWLAGYQQVVLARLQADADADGPDDAHRGEFVREEVGLALGLAPATAGGRLAVAASLQDRLPAVLAALCAGRIGYLHALVLVEETVRLDPGRAAAVADGLLPAAEGTPVGRLRRLARRAAIAADPPAAEQARRVAVADRRVDYRALPDGMAELRAVLPAEDAATVDTALDALAERDAGPDEQRPRAARRADALTELAAAALADPDLPRRHGAPPMVRVTVPLDTLLGRAEEPGDLAGYGPVTADAARRLAATGILQRLLTDPQSGTVLDYGRTTYRPPGPLADHVIARDGTCRFPQCSRPAERCDLDHTVPFHAGGPTSHDNLTALCRHHHRAKQAGWSVRHEADHSLVWTSPAGRRYITRPPPPDGRPPDPTDPTDRTDPTDLADPADR